MATKKKFIKIDEEAEAKINFMYAMEAYARGGNKAGLAKAKKEYPEIYAEWEKKHKAIGKK